MKVRRFTTIIIFSLMLCNLIACSKEKDRNLTKIRTFSWIMTGNFNKERLVFWDITTAKMPVLDDGRVLAISGKIEWPLRFQSSSELYDPQTGGWSYTGYLPSGHERDGFSAVTLSNGKILVVGGRNQDDLLSTLIYDPKTEQWSLTGSLPWAADGVGAYLLNNGKVLACGGYNQYIKKFVASCAIYDPQTEIWTPVKSMLNARQGHAGVVLPDGKVLMAGGSSTVPEAGSIEVLSASEIYDPKKDRWVTTGSLNQPRGHHLRILLNNGKVLAGGGLQFGSAKQAISSSELYDPATRTWTMTGSLPAPKGRSAGLLLTDGRVLNTGGRTLGHNWKTLDNCEIYDPVSGIWSPIASLNIPRDHHGIALLKDNRVLVAGGYNRETWEKKGGGLPSSEIYNLGIISFNTEVTNNTVKLTWMTTTKTNNFEFEIHKSEDKINFNKVGFLNGKGTTTKPVLHKYSFVDVNPLVGTFYYRIKQIAADGSFAYSRIIEVREIEDKK